MRHHALCALGSLSLALLALSTGCLPEGDGNGTNPTTMADPDMAEPDVTEPDMAEPDMAEPDMAEPDMAEPDMTEPDMTEPDMTEPDMTEPDMAEPDMAEPDMAEPDMTEPDMAEPDMGCELACPVPAARCDGQRAISYGGEGRVTDACECDYEDVRQVQDCQARGQVCQEGACVGSPDPCADVTCAPPGPSCQGDTALTYEGFGVCDPETQGCDYSQVEQRTDCAASGEVCRDGGCLDLCQQVACQVPEPSCVGTVAVRHDSGAACNPQTGQCDLERVRTEQNCAAQGLVCLAGTCGEPVDPCLGVNCPALADFCDQGTAIRFVRSGVCEPASGQCDYDDAVESEDCAAQGLPCQDGVCLQPPTRAPEPGELAIVEIMRNPEAVEDNDGEWFELLNTSQARLQLQGLRVTDDYSNQFTLTVPASTVLEPGDRYVIGSNANTSTNGGVAMDFVWPVGSFILSNGDDRIILYDQEQREISRVDWNSGWVAPTGASMQFGAEYDVDQLQDAGRWCQSRTALDSGDLGTPGRPNLICTLPRVDTDAYALGDEQRPDHVAPGTPVRLTDLVVTAIDVGSRAYVWVQAVGGGPFAGLRLDLGAEAPPLSLGVGHVVDVEGIYTEFYSVAQISVSSLEIVRQVAEPSPVVLTAAQASQPATAEAWEGMLVQVLNATVTDENPDAPDFYGEYQINGALRVDDLLYRLPAQPTVGESFRRIRGVLHHSFYNFKLEPRQASDYQR